MRVPSRAFLYRSACAANAASSSKAATMTKLHTAADDDDDDSFINMIEISDSLALHFV